VQVDARDNDDGSDVDNRVHDDFDDGGLDDDDRLGGYDVNDDVNDDVDVDDDDEAADHDDVDFDDAGAADHDDVDDGAVAGRGAGVARVGQ
jgi:hypothetical protein